MATLEDKILGEKREYYCSSSSDDENDSTELSEQQKSQPYFEDNVQHNYGKANGWKGVSSNTGPKGVIRDWQKFKQLEEEKRTGNEAKRQEITQRASMTCQSVLDEEKNKLSETDPELSEFLADEYLLEYQKQRMAEMVNKVKKLRFGSVYNLRNTGEFLNTIDNEDKSVTVIIHIYEKNIPGCDAMNGCLITLANKYPFVKFCKILGSAVNVSKHFRKEGIPALLVYKNQQVIGNFIHVTDNLGEDFYSTDVETFLTERGLLNNRRCTPAIILPD